MDQQDDSNDSSLPLLLNGNNDYDFDYLEDPQNARRRQAKRLKRPNLQTPTANLDLSRCKPEHEQQCNTIDNEGISIASSMLFSSSSLLDHSSHDHTIKNSQGRLIRRSKKRHTNQVAAIYRHNQMRTSLLRCNNNDDDDRGNKTTATITTRRHDGRRLMLICAIFALLYCVLNIVCIQPTEGKSLEERN